MAKSMYRELNYLSRQVFCVSLVLGLLLSFSTLTWSTPDRSYRRKAIVQLQRYSLDIDLHFWKTVDQFDKEMTVAKSRKGKRSPRNEESIEKNWKNYQRLTPEEKARIKRNYQEWKSMPPERQRTIRRRMEQWRGLTPDDQTLYEQIFRQWRKLPPEERRRTREKLENWNGLSKEEKDQIRRRFRVE